MHNSFWLHQRSWNSLDTAFCIHRWNCLHWYTHWHCFCTVDCLLMLYFILFRSKLEYTLPSNITTTNFNKLECVKFNFAAPILSHFSYILYNYTVAPELLQSHTVQVTRHHSDALFLLLLFMFFQDLNFVLPWLIQQSPNSFLYC
jgi:hypothetical protein